MNCHARSSSDGSENGKKLIIDEHNTEYFRTGMEYRNTVYEYQGDFSIALIIITGAPAQKQKQVCGAVVQLCNCAMWHCVIPEIPYY